MEHNENGTKLLLKVKDENGNEIDQYSITKGNGLVLGVQLSGGIQAFDQAEIGLYTNENMPLCAFGPFVITRVPVSSFIMSVEYIDLGVYHPEHQSKFAHVSYWTEDRKSKSVELDFKQTLEMWKQYLPNQESIMLKLMLSGVSEGDKKTFMRDIDIVKLIH